MFKFSGVNNMRELIYITDDLDSSSSFKQNKEKQNQPQGGAYITEMLKGAATNIMPTFANSTLARSLGFSILGVNPVSLVLALAVTSGPLVYILLKSKDKQLSAEEAKLIETEVSNLKVTKSEAKKHGYRFPPGHPISGNIYQKHPLSSNKDGLYYIPERQYESILTEERQSELIRLLTDLGATKIEISESAENSNDYITVTEITGGKAHCAELDISKKTNKTGHFNSNLIRKFTLSGKKWHLGQDININNFIWYDFEPQWQSLVYARRFGGCLGALIEMQEEQSLIAGSELAIALKDDLVSASNLSATTKVNQKARKRKSYLINIEFGVPIEPT